MNIQVPHSCRGTCTVVLSTRASLPHATDHFGRQLYFSPRPHFLLDTATRPSLPYFPKSKPASFSVFFLFLVQRTATVTSTSSQSSTVVSPQLRRRHDVLVLEPPHKDHLANLQPPIPPPLLRGRRRHRRRHPRLPRPAQPLHREGPPLPTLASPRPESPRRSGPRSAAVRTVERR
jgi:hypothetical protein